MSKMDLKNLSDLSMLELFRMEAETQSTILTEGVLGLEQDADPTVRLQELMRAAHSLKGAARIVGRKAAVRIAHAMEDCFVAIQEKTRTLSAGLVDSLLAGIDLLNRAAQVSDEVLESWEASQRQEIETFLTSLVALSEALGQSQVVDHPEAPLREIVPEAAKPPQVESTPARVEPLANTKQLAAPSGRVLRITADNLNRLMGLAGEALLTSRSLDDFAADMLREKTPSASTRPSPGELARHASGVVVERTNLRTIDRASGPCR